MTFQDTAVTAVLVGDYLPSHDEVYDLAESIGKALDVLRAYIASVRDEEQADRAVAELLDRLGPEARRAALGRK